MDVLLACSFCGRNTPARHLVAAGHRIFICHDCLGTIEARATTGSCAVCGSKGNDLSPGRTGVAICGSCVYTCQELIAPSSLPSDVANGP
jgi:hypothetical protein